MIIIELLRDYLFLLTALAAGLIGYRYYNRPFRILVLMVIVSLAVELAGRYMRVSGLSNLDLYYYYLLVEGLLQWLVAMYYFERKQAGGVLWISLAAFVGIWGYELVQSNFEAFADAHLMQSILLVVFYLIMLLRVINQPKAMALRGNPYFWLSLGFVIYNAGSIPCWAMFGHLHPDVKTAEQLYVSINNPLAAIQYMMMAISFYLYYRNARREARQEKQIVAS